MGSSPEFLVTKSSGALVAPCEPTPSGNLVLSSIDKIYITGFFVETLHVFKVGEESSAKVIREALGRALVPYYPMAGRLVKLEEGEVEVACTGDGVWFVEASAECRLEEVGWLEQHPLMIPKDQLLPFPEDPTGMIAMLQVTQFSCGGFVVGFLSDHTIADGLGVGQFLNAIAEMARGLKEPIIKPVWCRDAMPNPPKPPIGPPPTLPTYQLSYFSMDVSLDQINRLKTQFTEETGNRCSTFEVLTAVVWQCRTRAINLEPDVDVHLAFSANARPLLQQLLPPGGGYYGNCAYPVSIVTTSGELVNASAVEVVKLIRSGKEKFPDEFARWARGDFKDDPLKMEIKYESMNVVSGIRLGFDDVDYGWGRPAHVAPLMNNDFVAMCFLFKPESVDGVRLITQLVKKEHMDAFRDQMMKLHGRIISSMNDPPCRKF